MKTHTAQAPNLPIDKKVLKALYKLQPHRHAMAMALNWALILSTAVLCHSFFHPALYLLTILVIGARMHALAILMHDASHFRFLKNRKYNDLLTNLFTMYPLFTSITQYRENHLKHHRHLNTEEDPDWFAKLGKKEFEFPKSKTEFVMTVLGYFSLVKGAGDAFWFLRRFASQKPKKPASLRDKLPRILFYFVLLSLLALTGGWKVYLLYWVVPYFTTFFMFQYIRSVAEHFGDLAYDDVLTSSRTIKANLLERFFLSPHHVGYHLEHHLYPGVPYYNLPKLHHMLMELPEYQAKAHVTQGYLTGLMEELGQVEKGAILGEYINP